MVHFFNIENSKLESVLAKRSKECFLFVSKMVALGEKVVYVTQQKSITSPENQVSLQNLYLIEIFRHEGPE